MAQHLGLVAAYQRSGGALDQYRWIYYAVFPLLPLVLLYHYQQRNLTLLTPDMTMLEQGVESQREVSE